MVTRKNLIYLPSLLLILAVSSCLGRKQESAVKEQPSGTLVQVVDYRELDGCTFLLELENGEKLQPVNLDKQYQVAGKKLYVTWKNYDGMSICMSGKMVELLTVQEARE